MADISQLLKNFKYEMLHFEKKKLILPILAVMVILSAVFLGGHLRSQGFEEETMNASLYAMTELTVIFLENSEFNESVSLSSRERRELVDEKARKMNPMEEPLLSWSNAPVITEGVFLGAIYQTPFFPVAPGDMRGPYLGRSEKSVFFPAKKGYVLTKEMPETLALIFYRQHALGQLGERMEDRTNLTHWEFQQRVREIKSRGPQSERSAE